MVVIRQLREVVASIRVDRDWWETLRTPSDGTLRVAGDVDGSRSRSHRTCASEGAVAVVGVLQKPLSSIFVPDSRRRGKGREELT